MKKIIILAALTYLLIAPFTFHPDTKLTLLYPSLVEQKTLNIYQYLEKHPNNWPPFHYPPLSFLLLKIQFNLSKIIGSNRLNNWLSSDASLAPQDKMIFRFNLAVKYPLLILTIITGWVIYLITRQITNQNGGKQAALIWLFNPITLYAVVMMGQNDILAIFLFIVGLLFYTKKPKISFIFFGLAASTKTFPLLWTIIAALSCPRKNWTQKTKLFLLSFTIYLASLLPFLNSAYFRKNVLFSGLSMRMFASTINIGFQESVLIVPMLITLLLFLRLKARENYLISLSKKILSLNLIILGFSHFHPQWSLWTVPFFAILISASKKRANYTLLFSLFTISVFSIILLYKDIFLQLGIFSPVNPNLLNLPPIYKILSDKLFIDVNLINNLFHSVIAGLALYSIYLITTTEEALSVSRKKTLEKTLNFFYKKSSRALLTIGFLPTLFFFNFLIPTIEKETNISNQEIIKYISLKELKQKTLQTTVSRDNLYRIEILMKNPGLKSQDKFEIVILKNNSSAPVVAKKADAFNIGDPGYIRADIPRETFKKGDILSIQVRPLDIKDGLLQVGLVQKGEEDVFVTNLFYKPYFSITQTFRKSTSQLAQGVRCQPEVFILPLILSLI